MSLIRDILSRAEITTLHVAAARTRFRKLSERREEARPLRGREKRLKWLSKAEGARVLAFDRRVERAQETYASQVGCTKNGKLIMPIPIHAPRLPDLDLRVGKVA